MKFLSLLVAVSLVATSGALAAEKKQKKTKTKKAKPVAAAAIKAKAKKITAEDIKKSNTAVAATPATAPAPAVAPPAATTVAAAPAPAPKKPSSGFGLNWLSISGLGLKYIEGNYDKSTPDTFEVSSWEQPNIKYKINDSYSVAVMPQFFHTWFGDTSKKMEDAIGVAPNQLTQGPAFNMGNVALKLTNSKIFEKNGFKMDGQLRFDLPTSEIAQKHGEYGETWVNMGLSKSLGKLDLKGTLMGRIYHQQYATSQLVDPKNTQLLNKDFRHYQYVDIGYNFTEKFSAALELGTYVTYIHEDSRPTSFRPASVKMNRIADISLSYMFSKTFALSLGLNDMEGSINDSRLPFDTTNETTGGEMYLAASITI